MKTKTEHALKNVTSKAFAIGMLLMLVMVASMMLSPFAVGQKLPAGTEIPTHAFINVAPNPIGVGQQVNVNFFLSGSLISGEQPVNMTVKITDPDGHTETRGPYTGDTTGGTYFNFVPDEVGEWTFQFFYGGQITGSSFFGFGYEDLVLLPSQSKPYTLVVQEEPVIQSAYPITPLPTRYWETPVSAQNVQEWYKIMGPWLNLMSMGGNNATHALNPYTDSVLSGHVLWTKPWGAGGVVGGDAGGTEEDGHYWTTRQYWPQYRPVIINGKMYSQYYPETTGYSDGILATDLYTGETLFRINTTSTLLCGMVAKWRTPNQYGVIGPYLWTTGALSASETGGTPVVSFGTQFNLYSAETGQYVLSVVNGPMLGMGASYALKTDDNGHLLIYYVNSTVGTMSTYYPAPYGAMATEPTFKETVDITAGNRVLCCANFSQAFGNTWGWAPMQNTVIDFGLGVMWAKPIPTEINGVPIDPILDMDQVSLGNAPLAGDAVVFSAILENFSGWQSGYKVIVTMDDTTGEVLMCKNLTYPEYESLLPFTRYRSQFVDDLYIQFNTVNWKCDAINVRTGSKVWSTTLTTPYGDGTPNVYSTIAGQTNFLAAGNGRMVLTGFGGDIWCIDGKTGEELWYTNTTTLIGDPGIESPYGIWPLWVFPGTNCYTNDVGYFSIGHEYNPPLFHGAQLLAVNLTDGELIWSELGTYVKSVSIAYNVLLSLNCYDNQIYAFGKGASATTVSAPSVGVTTETPITITGTVMDISPGTQQHEVAMNFPNGLPCVSDESQSHWMEYVYQNQQKPSNATGVEVTLSVLDDNGNFREIGTTTSSDNGVYIFTWTPDIPGQYALYASFDGSNSYYGSCAETGFYASEAPQATPEPTPTPALMTDTYVLSIGAAAIIAIVAIGLVIILMLRKR